jgi:hypothetical protein
MAPIPRPGARRLLAAAHRLAGYLGIATALLLSAPRAGAGQYPRWEATVWGGYTATADSLRGAGAETTQSAAALRFLELAIWYSPALRLWVQYDDGLTLDAGRVQRTGLGAPSLYTGALIHWAGRFTTRLEGGWREIDGVGQRLVRGEQVIFIARPLVLKVGGWGAAGAGGAREFLAHGGVSWIPSARLQLGPTFFYAPRSHTRHVEEGRLLLSGEYRSVDGWLLGGGIAGGRSAHDDGVRERILDSYLLLAAPVLGGHEVRLLFRREEVGRARTLSALSVGAALRFGGK